LCAKLKNQNAKGKNMHKKDIYLLIAIAVILTLLILLVMNLDKMFPMIPIQLGGGPSCGN